MDASKVFDELRKRFEIKSDSALAVRLIVTPSTICKAREHGLSDTLMLRIHERLDVPIKEIRQMAN